MRTMKKIAKIIFKVSVFITIWAFMCIVVESEATDIISLLFAGLVFTIINLGITKMFHDDVWEKNMSFKRGKDDHD